MPFQYQLARRYSWTLVPQKAPPIDYNFFSYQNTNIRATDQLRQTSQPSQPVFATVATACQIIQLLTDPAFWVFRLLVFSIIWGDVGVHTRIDFNSSVLRWYSRLVQCMSTLTRCGWFFQLNISINQMLYIYVSKSYIPTVAAGRLGDNSPLQRHIGISIELGRQSSDGNDDGLDVGTSLLLHMDLWGISDQDLYIHLYWSSQEVTESTRHCSRVHTILREAAYR